MRIVFQQPLGEQHHENTFAAALGVPDYSAFLAPDALLRGLYARELMRPRHFLSAAIEDDEVADEIEQTVLVAHLGKRTVQNRAGGRRVCVCRLPFHKKLLPCGDRPVAQSLGIAAREHELYSGEKGLVENLLLIGNELANAVRHLDRAALQFDHGDGDAVQVEDEVRPALVPAAQGYFLG